MLIVLPAAEPARGGFSVQIPYQEFAARRKAARPAATPPYRSDITRPFL